MSTHRRWVVVVGLAASVGGFLPASGAAQEGAIVVQGSLRSRAEVWDWFGDDEGSEYAYLGTLLRVGVGQQWSAVGWQAEVAAPVLLGLPEDASAPAPRGQLGLGASYLAGSGGDESAASVFLKQGFLRVGAAPGTPGHGARLGRFEFVEGAEVAAADPTVAALKRDRIAHRLLGTFGWSHVGRSLDGAHYAYTAPGWNGTAVVARPTQGVFDVDGWPGLDVAVAYGALTARGGEGRPADYRAFILHYIDDRDDAGVVKTDNRPLATRQGDREEVEVTTLGGHALRVITSSAGPVDLLAWGVVQTGAWGAQDHRAWSAALEAGFQPDGLPGRPWLRVGHSRGSGDDDPTDDRHETFFQILPTPRIYARFPFHNGMNLEDTFVSLTLRPRANLALRTDARRLALSSGGDLWYAGGGAFEGDSFGYAGRPAGGATGLATLVDLSVEYRPTARLTVTAYGGQAWGGDVVEGIYGDGADGRLGYLEVEYRR